MADGMNELGAAIVDGELVLDEAQGMLVSAYIRIFGAPEPSQPREQVMARLMRAHVQTKGVPETYAEIDILEDHIIQQARAVETADIARQVDDLEIRVGTRLMAAVDRADVDLNSPREWYKPRLVPDDIKNDWGITETDTGR